MVWWFEKVDSDIHLVDGMDMKGKVKKLKAAEPLFVEVVTDLTSCVLSLKDFKASSNSVSEKFRMAAEATSRTKFIQTWIGEASSDDEEEPTRSKTPAKRISFSTTPVSLKKRQKTSEQPDMTQHLTASPAHSSPASLQNSSSKETVRDSPMLDVKEKVLDDCVLVHVDNLVQPADEVLVRPLDFNHVSVLENSFLKHPGQIAIMVGSVPVRTDVAVLSSSGTCKVQVLGGNHSRTALQNLNRKGLLRSQLVKMRIYSGLSTQESLKLGVHHNEVNTLSKELSFIEKVRLIRSMMPRTELRPTDIRPWKIKLKIVFGYEKIRQVSHNLKHHLTVARLGDDLYEKILEIDEAWSNGRIHKGNKKPIGQTFFRGWMKVEDAEDKLTCLETLLEEGFTAFKKKVGDFNNSGTEARPVTAVLSHQGSDDDDDDTNVEEGDKCDLSEMREIRLQLSTAEARCRELEAENRVLKDELKRWKENQKEEHTNTVSTEKRKLTEDDASVNSNTAVSFNVGDNVSALWVDKNGEEWNNAIVEKIYTNGDYHVKYWDNVRQRLKASRVKMLNTRN